MDKQYRVIVRNRMMIKGAGKKAAEPVEAGASVLLDQETYFAMTRPSSPNKHSIALVEEVNAQDPTPADAIPAPGVSDVASPTKARSFGRKKEVETPQADPAPQVELQTISG